MSLKIAGNANIGGSADIGGDATVSGNINVGNNLIFNPIASSSSSALGTVYYDSDDDALYLYNGALQRIAVDMTRYSADGVIANANYLEINHGQNTNDLSIIAWVKDKISGLWRTTESVSTTVKQSLENEFNEASASGIIRTGTHLTGVKLNPAIDVGTGADGDATISGTVLLDSTVPSPSGRSCADAANFSVTGLTANNATVANYSSGCFNIGDEVLLINVQGTSTAYGNTGNYETLRVASINSNTIGFTTAKTKYYGNGATDDTNIGTGATNQHVVLQRVPNYRNLTVTASGTLTVSGWSQSSYRGGILFFRTSESVTVGNYGIGSIHANSKGYLGGTNPVRGDNATNYGGESYCAVEGGGAGGNGDQSQAATNGVCGGGGGASNNPTTVGTGSSNGGAGGAGGNRDADGTTTYYGGGGAGAGYGTEGDYGYSSISSVGNGQAASGSQNGNGGAYSSTNLAAGGGGAGGTYGDAGLNKLYFGSGGGAGGAGHSSGGADVWGGAGGAGGGIVVIAANNLTVSGKIESKGANGVDGDGSSSAGGKGGGGAGGSIKIWANNATMGTNLITATGGTGATDSASNSGGNGGAGRIAVYYGNTVSGTTSPSYNATATGYYSYGLYHSPVISTPNATSYGLLTFDSAPTPYGKVRLQTRSGSSTNPTDGTWETWKPFTASTNYLSLQDANTHTDWSGTNATVAEGDVTRNVDYFEDEDESEATNSAKITSSVNGGYANASIIAADLSSYDYLTFWVRASQVGTTLRVGLGEAAATEQTEDIVIDVANTWQKVYWDLSDISASARDAVTKLRITNLTSTSNTFYIDNFRAEKLISTSGTKITSTPNNYFQYRVIFSTTNPAYQPAIDNISFTYQNGYKIEQTDTNKVRVYNYTGEEQELRLEAIVFGADLAEWYTVNDAEIGPGDVVAITGEMDEFGVPILRKSRENNDPMLLGVISTQAGTALGIKADNRRLLALDGRVPVKISPDSEPIKKGDYLTAAAQPGLARKAKVGELSLGRSFENWSPGGETDRVLAIVSDVMATPSFAQQALTGLTEIAQLVNYKIQAGWQVINTSTGEALDSALAVAQAIIGKLQVGQLEVAEIQAPNEETLEIKAQDIALQLGANQDSSASSALGKLMIQNQDQETVISFDSEGNASFSGELEVAGTSRLGQLMAEDASVAGSLTADNVIAEHLEVNSARMDYLESKLANLENATVSGTLYAENIEAQSIKANVISGLEERLSDKINETLQEPSLIATLFGENSKQTEEYIQQLQAEFNTNYQASAAALTDLEELAQSDGSLDLIADTAFINQYFEVNGNALISNSLKLGQSLMLGEDTIIGKDFISYQPQLADDADFTFSIQPAGQGKLSLMAGLMQLDGRGFVSITGDLKVAGVLEVEDKLKVKDTLLTNLISAENPDESIKVQLASLDQDPNSDQTIVRQNNFEFINEQATPVASFSATGDLALTGSLRLGQNGTDGTQPGQTTAGRSAGQAILQAGQTEVSIESDKVEENSMIYITPMNSTNNQVLYVKNKIADSSFTKENEGQFTVGIDYPLDHNVIFNWWIIQLN